MRYWRPLKFRSPWQSLRLVMALLLTATNLTTYVLVSSPAAAAQSSRPGHTANCQLSNDLKPRTAEASQPGLQTSLATKTYSIISHDIYDVHNQLVSCSPIIEGGHRYAASTDYSLAWSFAYQPQGDGLCTISKASVAINVLQIYPNWQPPVAEHKQWDRFVTQLKSHEDGHARLDLAAATDILNNLNHFPVTDCATIEATANKAAYTRLAALDQANASYDRQTGHGASQGATL